MPVTALENISLNVEDKEFSVIVGPSGCGKTSLLRLVAGLIEPTEGDDHARRHGHQRARQATAAWCSSPTRCFPG